jgi:hypothetical protein
MIGLLGAACGLDVAGVASSAEEGDGGTSVPPAPTTSSTAPPSGDASVVPEEAGPKACSTVDGGCATTLPKGWSPVLYAENRDRACPTNFASRDVVTNPVAPNGCTCNCTTTSNPTCTEGTVRGGQGTSCVDNGASYGVGGSNPCRLVGLAVAAPAFAWLAPVGPTKGACTSSVSKNDAALTSTPARACTPTAECAEDVCSGTAPAGFTACIVSDGDVACPSGPFTKKTRIGTGATFTCSGCTSCENTAKCSGGKLRYFNDDCSNEVASVDVDGFCRGVTNGGSLYNRYRYEATVSEIACKPSAPTTKVDLTGGQTVCCR